MGLCHLSSAMISTLIIDDGNYRSQKRAFNDLLRTKTLAVSIGQSFDPPLHDCLLLESIVLSLSTRSPQKVIS